ncbi:MAG: hypothetical protein J4F34_01015 [Gemmatimonadetes bacterium]|nr:hypothetical protein [Gemmatimonadota bacterium]
MLSTPLAQDTSVVQLAHDGLTVASQWSVIVAVVALLGILAALAMVLAEMRRDVRSVLAALDSVTEQAGPFLEHATGAVGNLKRVTDVISTEAERLNRTAGEVASEFGKLSVESRRRVADISALLDVAQSEAEDAVLDLAAKVRMLRRGAGLLARATSRGGDEGEDSP